MRKLPRLLALALVLTICLAVSASLAGAAAAPAGQLVDVLIGFRGQANPGLVRLHGGEVTYTYSIIPTVAARISPRAAEALSRNPNVEYVERDSVAYAHAQTMPWGIEKVNAPAAWAQGYTGTGVKVAVLDTGIDYNHSDLAGQVIGGWNTLSNNDKYMDDNNHGTHVAGTIAAVNNNIGVVGVAPSAKLYAVKVLDRRGSGTYSSIIAGIDWVVKQNKDHGADIKVINMSLGGGTHSTSLESACNKAYDAGVLLVASAGNNGEGTNTVGYPARYDSVVAVAASDSNDNRASFSSTGPAVELIAPGVGVLSTTRNNTYSSYNGTSMAAPHVAGVAALVFAADSTITNSTVRSTLTSTAKDLGLPANHQGSGLVDAAKALGLTENEPEPVYYTLTVSLSGEGKVAKDPDQASYLSGSEVTLTATADEGWRFDSWSGGLGTNSVVTVTMTGNLAITAVFVEEGSGTDPEPTELTVTVRTDRSTYPRNSFANVTISVCDPNGAAVAGAGVVMTVTDPGGTSSTVTSRASS